MTERARRLLVALADKGACHAEDLELTPAELSQALADLSEVIDDDHRPVTLVNTWHRGDAIVAVELTQTGRGLARALA